jgi:hypothetical protein
MLPPAPSRHERFEALHAYLVGPAIAPQWSEPRELDQQGDG